MSALNRQSSDSAPAGGGFRLGKGNAKFMGVCSGIANYFGLDVTLVRIAVVVATMVGVGSLIPIYLAIGLIAD